MSRSIIAKGKNIKTAVITALDLLEAQRDEVDIEIIRKESQGLFGIGKKQAKVRVTKVNKEHESSPLQISSSEEEIEDALENIAIENMESNNEEEIEASSSSSHHQDIKNKIGKVWVENGRIETISKEDHYPIISPCANMKLFVNEKHCKDKVIINEKDRISIEIEHEETQPDWEVNIDQSKMRVTLNIKKPGYKKTRYLKDKKPNKYIQLELLENRTSIPIKKELVLKKLTDMKVTYGIEYAQIEKACMSAESGVFIIAKGKEALKGKHGYFETQVGIEKQKGLRIRENGTVDYKDVHQFPSIERGQLIGRIHPPSLGIPGTTVTGDHVIPEETKPVVLQAGKGVVILEDTKVISTEMGHPEIKVKGLLVKVSVEPKLTLHNDINLKTGNIYFVGDVEVEGSVQENMKVEATGNISIKHNVHQGEIISGCSILVGNNIFSSQITAGQQNMLIAELCQMLGELVEGLQKMIRSIQQLSSISAFRVQSFTRTGLGPLIKILCDGVFKSFFALTVSMIEKIKKGRELLSDEWIQLGDKLYQGIVMFHHSNLRSIEDMILLTDTAKNIYIHNQVEEVDHQIFIKANYVHQSKLYSSGNISIHGKGSYNSILRAKGYIHIDGTVRGGQVFGDMGITVMEAGSSGGIISKFVVPKDKMIKINKAMENTVLQIGSKYLKVTEETNHICARLDESGLIRLK